MFISKYIPLLVSNSFIKTRNLFVKRVLKQITYTLCSFTDVMKAKIKDFYCSYFHLLEFARLQGYLAFILILSIIKPRSKNVQRKIKVSELFWLLRYRETSQIYSTLTYEMSNTGICKKRLFTKPIKIHVFTL
jgi:hypothetical protein